MLENRRRSNPRRQKGRKKEPSLRGGLMASAEEGGEFFIRHPEAEQECDGGEGRSNEMRRPWQKILFSLNVWSLLAFALFVFFVGALLTLTVQMWRPEDLSGIAGYGDSGAPQDLTLALKNAGGREITFTEGEINRYLFDTSRMRQDGLFSLIAHEYGVAVRIHDGYAEFIIDRVIGTRLHHTTAVYMSFYREQKGAKSVLRAELRGGRPILGSLPCGGRIGCVEIPQRHMEILRPALKTLADCYPEFVQLAEEYGYCPVFIAGHNGEEGRVKLVPQT